MTTRKKKSYKQYEKLSPFELKDHLIKLAKQNNTKYLNAGRGNPNFFNSFVRETYTYLQLACIYVSQEMRNGANDIRFYYLYDKKQDYYKLLKQEVNKIQGISTLHLNFISEFLSYLDTNELIHDLILSMIGCFYPSPPQIQPVLEKTIQEFMFRIIFEHKDTKEKPENFEYFAVEGASAGILYVFNTLKTNELLKQGDKIAIITPIFSPYLEMPIMNDYGLEIVELKGDPEKDYALPLKEIEKLKDTSIKALFMVNPGNPSEFSLPLQNINDIGKIVQNEREDLIVVSDSVYAPFVEEFNSFMYSCPKNTIEIYSLSKYFGVTGWRLGVVMIRKNNNLDRLIPNIKRLTRRYSLASTTPKELSLMKRIVMDSRQVAEAHVGGLSTPQQMMMSMMVFYQDHIRGQQYKKYIRNLLIQRMKNTYSKFEIEPVINTKSTNYYSLLDIPSLVDSTFGNKAKKKILKLNPYKVLFHLARKHGIVLLPGKGFGATKWKFRISLANLPTDEYTLISKGLYKTLKDLVHTKKTLKRRNKI